MGEFVDLIADMDDAAKRFRSDAQVYLRDSICVPPDEAPIVREEARRAERKAEALSQAVSVMRLYHP